MGAYLPIASCAAKLHLQANIHARCLPQAVISFLFRVRAWFWEGFNKSGLNLEVQGGKHSTSSPGSWASGGMLSFLATRCSCPLSLAATFCSLITCHSPMHTCHVLLSLGFCQCRTVSRKYCSFVPAGWLMLQRSCTLPLPAVGLGTLNSPLLWNSPLLLGYYWGIYHGGSTLP